MNSTTARILVIGKENAGKDVFINLFFKKLALENDEVIIKEAAAIPDNDDLTGFHFLWYAISAGDRKIEDSAVKEINALRDNGHDVCIVLTKIEELSKEELEKLQKEIKEKLYFAEIYKFSQSAEDTVQQNCDWELLYDRTKTLLPIIIATKKPIGTGKPGNGTDNQKIKGVLIAAGIILITALLIKACSK
jgi:septin family protein